MTSSKIDDVTKTPARPCPTLPALKRPPALKTSARANDVIESNAHERTQNADVIENADHAESEQKGNSLETESEQKGNSLEIDASWGVYFYNKWVH